MQLPMFTVNDTAIARGAPVSGPIPSAAAAARVLGALLPARYELTASAERGYHHLRLVDPRTGAVWVSGWFMTATYEDLWALIQNWRKEHR